MSGNNPGFPACTPYLANGDDHRLEIATKLNTTMAGKLNATVDVTLTNAGTTTTLNDPRIGYYSAVIPAMALTAHGSAAIVAGIWVDGLAKGTCTLHHSSIAQADQTIRFLIIG